MTIGFFLIYSILSGSVWFIDPPMVVILMFCKERNYSFGSATYPNAGPCWMIRPVSRLQEENPSSVLIRAWIYPKSLQTTPLWVDGSDLCACVKDALGPLWIPFQNSTLSLCWMDRLGLKNKIVPQASTPTSIWHFDSARANPGHRGGLFLFKFLLDSQTLSTCGLASELGFNRGGSLLDFFDRDFRISAGGLLNSHDRNLAYRFFLWTSLVYGLAQSLVQIPFSCVQFDRNSCLASTRSLGKFSHNYGCRNDLHEFLWRGLCNFRVYLRARVKFW